MAGVTAFGKPVSSGMASAILDAPSLNAAPSPSQPEHAPADGLAKLYAQLYSIAEMTMRTEQDLSKRIELERIVAFADSAMSEAATLTGSAGAPVPNLPMPPQPAPQAAPGGAMPPAAPPAPNPGAQGGPIPGAAA